MGMTIKGALSAEIMAACTGWSYIDDTSDDVDQVTLSFNASQFKSLPPFGAEYEVLIHGVSRGAGWKIIGSSIDGLNVMSIKLSTVEKYGLIKEKKTTSYVQKTLLEIITDVIKPCGYEVSVATSLANIKIDSFRKDETAGDYLNRIAKDHAAVSKPVNGVWQFKPKNDTTTTSGKQKPTVHIGKGNGKVKITLSESAHDEFKGVKVSYYDDDKGKLIDIERGSYPFDDRGVVVKNKAMDIIATYQKKHQNTRQSVSVEIPTSDPVVGMAFSQGVLSVDYSRFIKGVFVIDSVNMNPKTTTIKASKPNE